ncbi:hypothetical protein EJB05_29458, partial [Eragrostis curvula]
MSQLNFVSSLALSNHQFRYGQQEITCLRTKERRCLVRRPSPVSRARRCLVRARPLDGFSERRRRPMHF